MNDNQAITKNKTITISQHKIGSNHPTFIVAELSANHGGQLDEAIKLVTAAADAGADAIKLQTYTADTMTLNSNLEHFQIQEGPWKGRSLYDLYEEAHTPWEWHEALFEAAKKVGILCFSSPFDATAVDFLEQFDPPCYKVASFELTDIPLLKKIASLKKPVIFSTGMASLAEIEQAVDTFRSMDCHQLIGLRCVSSYPASPSSFRLKTISHLAETFDIVAGLSDHSLGSTVAIASVALGARVIEKHFTLARAKGGPDSGFSAEPHELAALIKAVRDTEQATASFGYGAGLEESSSIQFRRSIFAIKDIVKGELLSPENIKVIRPGYGLEPKHYENLIGQLAQSEIKKGTPLDWPLVTRNPL